MSNNIKIFLLVISSFFFTKICAQTNIYEIENEIITELISKYGSVYRIGSLEDVNKEINSYRDFKFPITDPYNTLKNCYIFQADVNSGALFGIYKNGTILWDSGTIIEFGEYSEILGAMDLNNDGKVDILCGTYYGMHNSYQSIWIFSWDGENGSIINEYYSDRDLNKSIIFSFDWYTEIYDVDGDGILEIKGQDKETRDAKIYSWNGSKYGDYGVPVPQYVPMNLLSAKVSCKVTPSEYGFLFNYSVNNDSTSKQPIWRFAVDKPFENVYAGSKGPNNKWNAYSSDMYDLFIWDINSDQLKFPFDFLFPGNIKSNFTLETATPIIIVTEYYLQGENGYSFPDEQFIYENSFKGVTISSTHPPNPFDPLDYIDTLLNYNALSLELGWITNQITADKYDSLFTTAKTQLQQNNNNAAKTTLQTVLQKVDIDSTNNLTSEAYALLRYNTEYLIEHLPIGGESISTYSIFATHSVWIRQNSNILSGSVGVNEAGEGPFLDSQLELSVGKNTTTPAGYTIKANRIKVKQNATVNADVYYNELTNNGTITGTLNTPLELPLLTTLPEFHSSTPGTEEIVVPRNGEYTLLPGAYGDIQIKKNAKLIFTGGEYNINNIDGSNNDQLLFQSESEVKIKNKFYVGRLSYIGPEDTTTLSAKDIVFYIEGINGQNGELDALPKSAKVGAGSEVKSNFYVPNGTMWIRKNCEVEGSFMGKDVKVGEGATVKLNSAF